MKKVVVTVISDLITDQRVHKVCLYLHKRGAEVLLIGRRFSDSQEINSRSYQTKRIHCYFRKGILQYVEFNLKLFFLFFNHKADLIVANDLDVLLPGFLHSKLKNVSLVYDSHEYFTGVPELKERPFKRGIWRLLERLLLPRLKYSYTVNDSIRQKYYGDYGIEMTVIRNLPVLQEQDCMNAPLLPQGRTRLLMQGAGINADRGFEEAILAMQYLPEKYLLVIIGGGTRWNELQKLAQAHHLADKVLFIPKVPFEILKCYTRQAHLGLTLDKPVSTNQELSSPNKLFDYIHAGVPVLATRLVEIEKVIREFDVGRCIDSLEPQMLAATIEEIFNSMELYEKWKTNTIAAAKSLSWQGEENKLNSIYSQLLT